MKKLVVLLAVVSMAGSGFAATNYWDGSTGSWTNTAKWSLGTVPGDTADYAFINGGTAQITAGAVPSGAITQTQLGGASGANIEISADVEFKDIYMAEAGQTATISQTGGNVLFTGSGTTHIGRYGTGSYNLSGGTLTHNSTSGNDTHTFIGVYSTGVGAMNLSGTGSFVKNGSVAQNIYVGFQGNGTVDLSDSSSFSQSGTVGNVYVGNSAGSTGTINVRDTASVSLGKTYIGSSGYGEVNQSGGTFSIDNYYSYVGVNNGSTGVVNLTSGTFEKSSHNGHFYVGNNAGAVGVLNVSGGTLDMTCAIIELGQNGHGELNQTGGDVDANYIIMGNAAAGDGSYTISAGSVDVDRYIYLHYGDSSMTVDGSGADHIKADRFLVGGNTMNINLDAAGSTLIEVDGAAGSAYFNAYANGTWNIDTLAGFDGVVGDTYDILWSATDILNTNTLNLVNVGATEFDWSIIDNVDRDGNAGGTGKMLQVTVIPEPATLGMIAFIGGAMVWIRRKFMI